MDLKKIHTKALPLYEEISSIALKHFEQKNLGYHRKDEKEWTSLVTEADYTINEILLEKLPEILPGSGVIGEEISHYHNEEFVWVVDPIDGTGNYHKGIDFWGISISLWNKTDPIYGVLLHPRFVEKMIYGIQGEGVFNQKNKKIERKKRVSHKPGFSIKSIVPEFETYILGQDFGEELSYRATGSATVDGYNMIKGGYDFLIIYQLAPWDIGAVEILSKEVGYTVDYLDKRIEISDPTFATYEHRMFIAKPDIDKKFFEIISNALQEFEKNEQR